MVTGVEDILVEYEAHTPTLWSLPAEKERAEMALTPAEKQVLECLSIVPIHIDTIMTATGLQPGDINNALLQLEMAKFIRRLPGGFYLRY